MKGDISFPQSVKGLREAHGENLSESFKEATAEFRNVRRIETVLNLPPKTAVSYSERGKHSSLMH